MYSLGVEYNKTLDPLSELESGQLAVIKEGDPSVVGSVVVRNGDHLVNLSNPHIMWDFDKVTAAHDWGVRMLQPGEKLNFNFGGGA
jgi:hypothetical protein